MSKLSAFTKKQVGAAKLRIVLLLVLALIGRGDAREPEGKRRASVQVDVNELGVTPVFKITSRTAEEISGSLQSSKPVAFSSRMVMASKAVLQVHVGEIALDGEADFASGVRTLNGHGHRLSLVERNSLEALALELERRLNPYSRNLPQNEDFLFRVVSYWSQAPVGWPLELRVVSAPTAQGIAHSFDSPEAACQGGGSSDPPDCSGNHCGSDNDGISLLSGGCNCTAYSGVFHDTHKWTWRGKKCKHGCTETLTAGCDFDTDCLGRCGAGCGLLGRGQYTMDCLDHDRCCRVHGSCTNPFDVECGDEYIEAADDFLYAITNCFLGCRFSAVCGDATCDAGVGEDTCSCPGDCGESCGDGCCNGSEDALNCAIDCATVACCLPANCCRDDLTRGDCLGIDGNAFVGMTCAQVGGLCPPPPDGCPEDLPTCGDGICDAGEDSCNCSDCITCGDGCCGSAEDESICPQDCLLGCIFTDPQCCLDGMTAAECSSNGGTPGNQTCSNAGIIDCEFVASQVPAVSEWGLIVITLLVLTAGTIIIGRRRRNRPTETA